MYIWLISLKYRCVLMKRLVKDTLTTNNKALFSYFPGASCSKLLSLCYLPQPSASADNTNLCLNNSSYPTRPHSIIV